MRTLVTVIVVLGCGSLPGGGGQPREGSWMEQVERERGRGAGGIIDQPTYELERIRDRADVVAGRIPDRREFERLDEERDRQLQIEKNARESRPPRLGEAASPTDTSGILRQRPIQSGVRGPGAAGVRG